MQDIYLVRGYYPKYIRDSFNSMEAKRPLLVGTVILVFLSIFPKSQASSPFEAVDSMKGKCASS